MEKQKEFRANASIFVELANDILEKKVKAKTSEQWIYLEMELAECLTHAVAEFFEVIPPSVKNSVHVDIEGLVELNNE